jgi:hypothetical protein
MIAMLLPLALLIYIIISYQQRLPEPPVPVATEKPESRSLPYAPPGTMRIVGEHRFGCADREYFRRLVKMKAQGDTEAVTNGIRIGLATGECVSFDADEPVYLEDQNWGLIKVRKVGQQTGYWTFMEAAS